MAPVAQPLGVYKTPGMLRYIALVECYVTRQPRGGEDLQGLSNGCHKLRGSKTARQNGIFRRSCRPTMAGYVVSSLPFDLRLAREVKVIVLGLSSESQGVNPGNGDETPSLLEGRWHQGHCRDANDSELADDGQNVVSLQQPTAVFAEKLCEIAKKPISAACSRLLQNERATARRVSMRHRDPPCC